MTNAVFGMGIALINHWAVIKKNWSPQLIIDNNKKKWGTVDSLTGLKCISLEEALTYKDLHVLITVGDPYAIRSISSQLTQVHVSFSTLVDHLDEWCRDLPMPPHLSKLRRNEKKILLFNTPEHDNIGDHLIGLAQKAFLKAHFSDYALYEVTDIEYLWHHAKIKPLVNNSDILLISGGGFLGSLWLYNGEENVRSIIREYPDNHIVILPQTMFFEDNDRGHAEFEKTTCLYRQHPNLTLCARDWPTYQLFKKIRAEEYVHYLPDMALLCRPEYTPTKTEKKEVLLCLRHDKESILSPEIHESIKQFLTEQNYRYREISMHSGICCGIDDRASQVFDKFQELSSAEFIITDTLHCMISAALMGTETYVLDNLSGKVRHVYQWIDALPYIRFNQDVNECFDQILHRKENTSCTEFSLDFHDYENALVKYILEK